MTPNELRIRFEEARPWLVAWGDFVKATVAQHFRGRPSAVGSEFFVMPPQSRVKDANEFVAKARRPGKSYSDPWKEITDKVGVRFVCLLNSDARQVCEFIATCEAWTASHDRDHEGEKIRKPTEFLYASEHYIIRPTTELVHNSIAIPIEATCEVQVRTLLQHGYSELTHNTVYKGALADDSDAVRRAARSMALIETTDDIFETVATKISAVVAPVDALHNALESTWKTLEHRPLLESTTQSKYLLDALWPAVKDIEDLDQRVTDFFRSNQEARDSLANAPDSEIFRQPVSLLLYYLAKTHQRRLKRFTILTRDELEDIEGITGVHLGLDA